MSFCKCYLASVLFLSFGFCSECLPANPVNYENIGVWVDKAAPQAIELVPDQNAVNSKIQGVNKLKALVCVDGEHIRNYVSGLFTTLDGDWCALVNVLAKKFTDINLTALDNCRLNGRTDYDSELAAVVALCDSLKQYLVFCQSKLKVEDSSGKIKKIQELANIMTRDGDMTQKLVDALRHINTHRSNFIVNLFPAPSSGTTSSVPGNLCKLALQEILSKLKDDIRNVAAHSEMIALFDIFYVMQNKFPIKLVSKLDMCYQCEKACVSVLSEIKENANMPSRFAETRYKILVGSYNEYSNDGMDPRGTRKRLKGKANDLVKIALDPSDLRATSAS